MDMIADIKVRTNQTYPVEEKVFGHFIEHLGRCIRNGIWDERDTGAAYAFGRVRVDVLDAMQGLRPPVLRWPGGCFSDTYHWRDGVGPRRPRRVNRAWWWLKPDETAFEDNHFGTHEFMELCRALDTEPYININFGPGSPDEAAAWAKDLKKRGFKFLGPTVVYAHMQATGMVNDHTVGCFRYGQV